MPFGAWLLTFMFIGAFAFLWYQDRHFSPLVTLAFVPAVICVVLMCVLLADGFNGVCITETEVVLDRKIVIKNSGKTAWYNSNMAFRDESGKFYWGIGKGFSIISSNEPEKVRITHLPKTGYVKKIEFYYDTEKYLKGIDKFENDIDDSALADFLDSSEVDRCEDDPNYVLIYSDADEWLSYCAIVPIAILWLIIKEIFRKDKKTEEHEKE